MYYPSQHNKKLGAISLYVCLHKNLLIIQKCYLGLLVTKLAIKSLSTQKIVKTLIKKTNKTSLSRKKLRKK